LLSWLLLPVNDANSLACSPARPRPASGRAWSSRRCSAHAQWPRTCSSRTGILFGIVGILLGAAFPALDFKQVDDAVAYGAPRKEAWLSALGLTTMLVWIYLEVLCMLTVFNSDN
jgi:hypothetical protein